MVLFVHAHVRLTSLLLARVVGLEVCLRAEYSEPSVFKNSRCHVRLTSLLLALVVGLEVRLRAEYSAPSLLLLRSSCHVVRMHAFNSCVCTRCTCACAYVLQLRCTRTVVRCAVKIGEVFCFGLP